MCAVCVCARVCVLCVCARVCALCVCACVCVLCVCVLCVCVCAHPLLGGEDDLLTPPVGGGAICEHPMWAEVVKIEYSYRVVN